jgi:hypothetical protein
MKESATAVRVDPIAQYMPVAPAEILLSPSVADIQIQLENAFVRSEIQRTEMQFILTA